jgi:hypothetical protein
MSSKGSHSDSKKNHSKTTRGKKKTQKKSASSKGTSSKGTSSKGTSSNGTSSKGTSLKEDALKAYTVKSDFYINGLLRDGLRFFEKEETRENMIEDGFSDPVALLHHTIQQIRDIDSSFVKRSKEGMILYRGTKTLRKTPYLGKNAGYISTSKSTNYFETRDGERFISLKNKCCLYIYELAAGIPYIDLQNISHFKDQEEVLLPRGLTATLIEETKTTIGKTPMKTYIVRLEGPHVREPYTLNETMVDTSNIDYFKDVQLSQVDNLYDKYGVETDMFIEGMTETYGGEVERIVSEESYKKLCMRFLKDVLKLSRYISKQCVKRINEMLRKGEPITPDNFLQIE